MENNLLLCIKNNQVKIINNTKNSTKDNDIIIQVLGNIYNLDGKKILINELKALYFKYKTKITKYVDGIYSIFIYDYKLNKGYIFQDRFGSNQYLYYYKNKDEIIISNCLKNIIKVKPNDWTFNNSAVKMFLDKGYIANSKTLVKDIYKIPNGKYLIIDKHGKIYIRKSNKIQINKLEKMDFKIYEEQLNKSCKSSIQDNREDVSVTISSGYDSNFLLHLLEKNNIKNINAFSIGGKIGVNETENAKKICSYYNNIKFHSKLIDSNTLLNFPEIVWSLEGAVYERGIFLQYELAKMIKENNKNEIILGDCADQVFRYELYHKNYAFIRKTKYNILRKIKQNIKKTYSNHNTLITDVNAMLSSIILKKNGILM